jgi:hypothetical protein
LLACLLVAPSTVIAQAMDQPQQKASNNTYTVLQYTYVPDILQKRDPYRAGHLENAKKMVSNGNKIFTARLPYCPFLQI